MKIREAIAKQAKKSDATTRYTIDCVRLGSDKAPVLTLRYADDIPAFTSGLVKHERELRTHSATGADSEEVQNARMRVLLSLLAKSGAVVAWNNVLEDDKPAPCTAENVEELLHGLYDARTAEGAPDKLLKMVAVHILTTARNVMNFRASAGSGEELGKG
jgi:hypothetical protein